MIRRLTPADLPLAAEVIRASFATVAREFGITERNCPRHTSFITIEELQQHFDKGYMMYGLYEGNKMVGYVSLKRESDGAFELNNLAVLPEYRHQGYGRQLVDFCKAKVKELGGSKITIGIIEESTVLKDWYAANRFVHTGTQEFVHLPFIVGFMEWYAGK